MDKGALELFFLRSKIFFLSVGWNFFEAVHLFSINQSDEYCTIVQAKSTIKINRQVSSYYEKFVFFVQV